METREPKNYMIFAQKILIVLGKLIGVQKEKYPIEWSNYKKIGIEFGVFKNKLLLCTLEYKLCI